MQHYGLKNAGGAGNATILPGDDGDPANFQLYTESYIKFIKQLMTGTTDASSVYVDRVQFCIDGNPGPG